MAAARPQGQPNRRTRLRNLPAWRGLTFGHNVDARLTASLPLLLWLLSASSAACSMQFDSGMHARGGRMHHTQKRAGSAFTISHPERATTWSTQSSRDTDGGQQASSSSRRLLITPNGQTAPQQAADQALNRCAQRSSTADVCGADVAVCMRGDYLLSGQCRHVCLVMLSASWPSMRSSCPNRFSIIPAAQSAH